MNVVLLSTYDLGHQPFGLASPAAWLREAGASVTCNDLALDDLDEQAVLDAGLIAVYLPMHTATRLAGALVPRLKRLNPTAHVCFYGLYAPLNEDFLRRLGGRTILGGEFESGLVSLYERLSANGAPSRQAQSEPLISLAKQRFRVPDRAGLPPLERYAHLETGNGGRRTAGYTEASRGCKHVCRHCPVVPVYGGRFRIVQLDAVMEDVRRQVAAGAGHITFGDPDFFNGVGHAMRLVEALNAEFPRLTYDVTIKIEHLLDHARHLGTLAQTGCLFVTTAVESVDDRVLGLLDKGHTRADFIQAVGLARDAGLTLSPTFIPFTPWTTLEGYLDLLAVVAELDLVAHVAPIQLGIRLLLPRGSWLLRVPELQAHLGDFDPRALSYRWSNPDPRVDGLWEKVARVVEEGEDADRGDVFERIWRLGRDALGLPAAPAPVRRHAEACPPHLSEPWYCCAEPTSDQFARI
jgi:radical SAM superfamily enzyme YgiQ (UPF0313 family)